jgi:hypothetical protein
LFGHFIIRPTIGHYIAIIFLLICFLDEIESLASDESLLLHSYHISRVAFCNEMVKRTEAICEREAALLNFAKEKAVALTCDIAELHNAPRKASIAWRKEQQQEMSLASEILEKFVVKTEKLNT